MVIAKKYKRIKIKQPLMFSRAVKGGDVLLSRFRSTIGSDGLNVPVRDGKGWIPVDMVTVFQSPRFRRGDAFQRIGVKDVSGRDAAPRPSLVAGSRRAISTARLWRHRLYTCSLSTW